MSPVLSVVICTHNPRPDYLRRVLDALQAQTLPLDRWELIVVDNASKVALSGEWDLSWHPKGRHVREDELGLTNARLKGIAEAQGPLIVFVDDDNVLEKSYLQISLEISKKYPILGAWGGNLLAELEAKPDPWFEECLPYLAVRSFQSEVWSNNPDEWRARPCGAGLSVRAIVAKAYAEQLAADPARRKLDRVGTALTGHGDHDLTEVCYDRGLGCGNFPGLVLTHLMPESRLRKAYLKRLIEATESSSAVFQYLRRGRLPPKPRISRAIANYLIMYCKRGKRVADVYWWSRVGSRSGFRAIEKTSSQRNV